MRRLLITRISLPSSSPIAGYNPSRSLLELDKSRRMASSTMMAHQQRHQQRWVSSNSEEFPPPLPPSVSVSSTSLSSPFHQRPLHRNPSRIVSAIGSIYRPPDFFLGVDNLDNDNDDDDDDDNNCNSDNGRSDDDGYGPFLFLPEDDMVVADSIGSCIKIEDDENDDKNNDDHDYDYDYTRYNNNGHNTEMSICFLGTGSGSPACRRSTSGTVVKLAGTNYLFDAGEGIQRQFQFARGKNTGLQNIEKIFVTHMHGDHIFGLPGLLLSLQTSYIQQINDSNNNSSNNKPTKKKKGNKQHNNTKEGQQPTVKIYGPPGLFNYIASSITLSCSKLHTLNVEVYELIGGRVRKSTPPRSYGGTTPSTTSYSSRQQQQYPLPRITPQNIRDPFHDDYLEYHHYGGQMKRIQIPCENGVWNIQDVKPVTREDIVIPTGGGTTGTGGGGAAAGVGAAKFRSMSRKRHERIRIKAAEVDHLPGVATFGFVIEEDEPPYNLDVEKARFLGVSPTNKKYDLLKYGFPVIADMDNNNSSKTNIGNSTGGDSDGGGDRDCDERVVYPHEVVKSTTKKARKIAFIGDNRGWTREMFDIARNTDVLIHEATLVEEDYKRGHSTAAMTGKNGANCDAKLLILNHISPKMEDILSKIVREAYDATGKKLSVLVSFDFMEVHVPWLGFGTIVTGTTNATSESDNSSTSTSDISMEPKDTKTGVIENNEDNDKKTTANRSNIIGWTQDIFAKSPK